MKTIIENVFNVFDFVNFEQATDFYENLLMRLQQMYKINLKELFANVSAYKQLLKRIGKRVRRTWLLAQLWELELDYYFRQSWP